MSLLLLLLYYVSLTHVGCPMNGSPVLLVKCVNVRTSGQQQLHHLTNKSQFNVLVLLYGCLHACVKKKGPTSTCPLKAAWCRAVRPARSDTLTLLSSGTNASAQRTALLLAAKWSGVCQFLSRALTSALCFSNIVTASWKDREHGSDCTDRWSIF